jgi:hypothetical protein
VSVDGSGAGVLAAVVAGAGGTGTPGKELLAVACTGDTFTSVGGTRTVGWDEVEDGAGIEGRFVLAGVAGRIGGS